MSDTGPIWLATRGSDLARTQAGTVRDALERRRREAELVTVETTGDRIRDELVHRLGITGAFVRSLDERVLAGDVDAAVHSMKDVPTEGPEDLVVAAVPERAPAGDVLVTPTGATLSGLPEGATVGTSSLRRGAQLSRERPDLRIEPLRGNVDTRIEKLLAPALRAERERRREAAGTGGDEDPDDGEDHDEGADDHGEEVADGHGEAEADGHGGEGADGSDEEGADSRDEEEDEGPGDAGAPAAAEPEPVREWIESLSDLQRRALDREVDVRYDAVVLAAAGLDRIGLLPDLEVHHLPRDRFVPAPGQGALAVTTRAGASVHDAVRAAMEHPPTRIATTAERTILAELGGGCVAPLGVHASLQGRYVHVRVQVLSRDGEEAIEASRDLPAETYVDAARSLADELEERGAAELIERAKRETGADEGGSSTGASSGAGASREGGDAEGSGRGPSSSGSVGGPSESGGGGGGG